MYNYYIYHGRLAMVVKGFWESDNVSVRCLEGVQKVCESYLAVFTLIHN